MPEKALSELPKIVAFEGIDNCGKTGIIERFAAEYPDEVVWFRHCGEGPLNSEIRKTVLRNDGTRHTLMAEALLFAADLANLVENHVKPALLAGKHVLIDRYWLSSVVYQGHGDGMDIDFIEEISVKACFGLPPARHILLDIPAEESLARQGELDGQYEGKLDVQRKVRAGYLFEASKRPNEVDLINGVGTPEEVYDRVSCFLEHFLFT